MNTIENTTRAPGIPIRPPFALYWGLALGGSLEHVFGQPVPWLTPPFAHAAGALLITLGIVVMTLAMRAFKKAQTNVRTDLPATRLVTEGIYRLTRNPMYLAFLLIALGVASCFRSIFLLAGILPFFLYVRLLVIPTEERYMREWFGEAYAAYREHTGRWFGTR